MASLAQRLKHDCFDVEIYSLPVGRRYVKPILGDVVYSEKWLHNIDADVALFIYSPYVEKFFKFKNGTAKIASIHGFPLVPELQHKLITDISLIDRIKNIGITRSFIWWHSTHMRNFKNFDAIHINNPAMRKIFNNGERIYEIPNWIDTELYCPCNKKDDDFTVIFVSRNEWVKGIDLYDEISKRKDLGIKFLCTGNKTGNYDSIGFIEDESQLASIYSKVHATIIPTRIDTFGVTITESLSCGTPVITTRMPPHEELKLPIIYADTIEEFINEIYKIKKMWENDRESYYKFCSICKNSVSIYAIDNIYPQFKKMFCEVAKGL